MNAFEKMLLDEFDRMFNPVPNLSEMMQGFELTLLACGWTFDEYMFVWGAYVACYLLEKDFCYGKVD